MESWLEGGGEVGALMRRHDWSRTPLGPAAQWPQSLRTIVRIMLTSRYAMWLGWGPELTMLYNDPYARIIAAKHPAALGSRTQDVWSEIWDEISPRIQQVLSTGEATFDEALLLMMERHGYVEETYFTFSYSPLFDDAGHIAGNFCVVTEDTDRVIGERRLALLRDLAACLAQTTSEEEVFRNVASCLSAEPHDLPFSMLYLFDGASRRAQAVARSGFGAEDAAEASIDMDDPSAPWGLDRIASGVPSVTVSCSPGMPRGCWDVAPSQVLVLPLAQQGQSTPAGALVAGLNPFRPLDESYRSFIRLVVGQASAALANARAYEEERRRGEALAAIDRAKTAFFSNVSHEFRTPLTLMLGPTQDALASGETLDRDQLDTIYRNQLRLLKLVNSLLDFSRIEAGRANATYEPTDLSALTADLASTFRSAVERGGLRFEVDCSPLPEPIYVDRGMWEKIVLNLLSNAFKFTFDGHVRVTMRWTDRRAVLTVEDTGAGIPRHELSRVFDRFHRIEGTRARTHEGSGIGLALVRDLVALHGGEVGVASEVNRGTTFTVTIPAGRAHLNPDRVGSSEKAATAVDTQAFLAEAERWLDGAAAGAPDATAPAGTRPRILVADDNADMREYVTRLLSSRWDVEAVTNGSHALAAALRDRPDLVITDVMMPELDGFGLVAALRGADDTKDIRVLMLSARAGEEARLEGLQAGADDYLVKPFSARELLARVEMQLLRASTHAELVRARRDAESANRAKDEFLAMLGHELRNPLAPMLTALQLMRLRGDGVLQRERTVIERQTRHLVRLVDDLLDVSRIARGKIELRLERIDVADVVAKAIEMASPLLEEREHDLEVEVPRGFVVDGDSARLAQIVANLLTNAAKYTEKGGVVAIEASAAGDVAVLTVRDSGIGIAPEMLPRVFDMFAQERQALDRTQGGLGLGLTIVKNLTELHRGTVSVRSEGRNKGSEFVVRLPLAAGGPVATGGGAVAAPRPPAAARSGPSVLIVDDNEDAAAMLTMYLESLGYRVRAVHDGPAALRAVALEPPQIALLDIGLPVMDGYELALQLRQLPEGAALRLIAVTGYGQATDRERSRAAGFDAHMVKPVDLEQLADLLGAFSG
jgi:signal transduction histidine kinase